MGNANDWLVETSRDSLRDMLFYYAVALISDGVVDPKQRIATEIPEILEMSVEQARFISSKLSENERAIDNLDKCMMLIKSIIKKIENNEEVDTEQLKVINKVLGKMKKEFKEAKERYEENGKE